MKYGARATQTKKVLDAKSFPSADSSADGQGKVVQRPFAVFDIDGTIIRWQLYHAIVHELAKMKAMGKAADDRIKHARMTWKERHHHDSFHEYEMTLLETYRKARQTIKVSDFDKAIDTVFDTYKDQVYTYTRDLIKQLKAEGYVLLAISGSHQKIIEKLGEYYGFDEVVGSRHGQTADGMMDEGDFSPIQSGKGPVLQDLIKKHDLTTAGSYAVGDSLSDAAMLEMVDNPIAFNPDSNLFEIAKAKGWNIVIERKNVIYQLHEKDGHYQLS
jgi:HAD superfamily hydrolase (TIGR01490 family)